MKTARVRTRFLVDNELIDSAQAAQALQLLDCSAAFDEDMAFKQALFGRMDAIAKPDAILASNTSGLSITTIALLRQRPERVLTSHFWNPLHLMPPVEIVLGEKTSPEVAQQVRHLLITYGKVPVIVKKDRPGQLGNRLQMALVREAANIIAEGIAIADDVDLVAKNGFGLRMPAYGILEHQDLAGLDFGLAVLEYVVQDLYNEPRAPEHFRALVRQGDLGAKTGKGFYDWSLKSSDAVKTGRDEFLVEVLRGRRRKASRS